MMTPELGQRLWRELHTFAWLYPDQPGADVQRAARAWLADFSRRLPYGCSCRREWDTMVGLVPPPLTSRAELYWWTVAAHDVINAKLRKPLAAPEWSMAHPLMEEAIPF